MAEKRELPRKVLSRNLKALLAASTMTAPEVAKQAGVDRKTLNNQINGRYDPRPEQVDAVASVFGLNCWQLLSPTFRPTDVSNGSLEKLLGFFADADEEGKDHILKSAAIAARPKR